MFFVINSPCTESSTSGIDIKEYGWSKDIWKSDKLKKVLLDVGNLKRNENFFVAKKTDEMKKTCEKAKTKKNFHSNRKKEKIVIYKSKPNEFLSICNHIRNSLAHGRFNIFDGINEDDIYVFEDGIKRNGKIQVRSRIILKKSTLLKWIEILEKGSL